MTTIVIFVLQFVSGAVYVFFQAQFWRRMKEILPDVYDEIGGPRSMILDISLWRMWSTYRYILSGAHRKLGDKKLQVIGDIVLFSAPMFFFSFIAALIVMKTPVRLM